MTKCLKGHTKKGKIFDWTEQCKETFLCLKQKLINSPILQYPDFDKPFILTTNFALGAILLQGEIGNNLLITYASRTLNKHEINKPVIEKELLAIAWGIEFFRPYLFGKNFMVVTDHRPLVSLLIHTNPSSKLTCVYRKGNININADA